MPIGEATVKGEFLNSKRRVWSAECGSPEMPGAAPDDPDTEQEVRDGMSRHGVPQPFFPANESLVGYGAEDARQPFIVSEAEDQSGEEEWLPCKPAEGHGCKMRPGDPPIEERAIKHFFDWWDDE